MNNEILVSISCTTYNHASYIRECFEGFLMQETKTIDENIIFITH